MPYPKSLAPLPHALVVNRAWAVVRDRKRSLVAPKSTRPSVTGNFLT